MLRMTLVAAAAALLAGSASAQSIHISTVGKTPAQLKAEVVKAAQKLCGRETAGASFPIEAQASCVAASVRAALAQAPAAAYAQR